MSRHGLFSERRGIGNELLEIFYERVELSALSLLSLKVSLRVICEYRTQVLTLRCRQVAESSFVSISLREIKFLAVNCGINVIDQLPHQQRVASFRVSNTDQFLCKPEYLLGALLLQASKKLCF